MFRHSPSNMGLHEAFVLHQEERTMLLVDRLIVPAMRGKGKMPTSRIYRSVKIRAMNEQVRLTPQWRATVRNTLQRYCRDSDKYVGSYYFVHHDRGLWECRNIN